MDGGKQLHSIDVAPTVPLVGFPRKVDWAAATVDTHPIIPFCEIIRRGWIVFFFLLAALLSVAVHLAIVAQCLSFTVSRDEHAPIVIQLLHPWIAGYVALSAQTQASIILRTLRGKSMSDLPWTMSGSPDEELQMPETNVSSAVDDPVFWAMLCVSLLSSFIFLCLQPGSQDGLGLAIFGGPLLGVALVTFGHNAVQFYVALSSYFSNSADDMHRQAFSIGCCILAFTFCCQLCIGIFAHFIRIPLWYSVILMVVSTNAVGMGILNIFRRFVLSFCACCRHVCPTVFSIFTSILLVSTLMTVLAGVAPSRMGSRGPGRSLEEMNGAMFTPPKPGTAYDEAFVSPSEQASLGSYPICRMRWGRGAYDATRLSVLDLAAFAEAVYAETEADILAMVLNATANTDLGSSVVIEDLESVESVARLVVFALPSIKVRVIAFRGSQQVADWRKNADIWAPSALFQLVKLIMPFGQAISMSVSRFVAVCVRSWFGIEPVGIETLEFVRAEMRQSAQDGYFLVLTGHSLGGGVAQLIGASEGISALGFSPVGATSATYRVGLSHAEAPIESNAVAIVPWGDVVPLLIDMQTGVVQYISCNTFNVVRCHDLRRAACEIYRRCGDPRGRDMSLQCLLELGPGWDAIPWGGFAWGSR